MAKLIEVALPVEEISAASRADKDRKTGTIKNVHKWFAPMPTPAWRALLFAALVDDPGEGPERDALLRLIKRLVPSDGGAPKASVLDEARAVLQKATGGNPPVVYDPFCGGGSTLVEALRLGLPAAGSDLNPVPVLITKVLTELVPKVAGRPPIIGDPTQLGRLGGGPLDGLLADLRHYAERVRAEVWEDIGHLYPPAPGGGTIVAWLWARTVVCPSPACRAIAPLLSSLWLSKRAGAKTWLEIIPDGPGAPVRFEVRVGDEGPADGVKAGRGKFRCPTCAAPILEEHLRNEATAGRFGVQLMAVAVDGPEGRTYLSPSAETLRTCVDPGRPDDAPEIALEGKATINIGLYGFKTQADIYTNRQLAMLGAFADAVARLPETIRSGGGDEDQVRAISAVLGLMVGKLAMSHSTQARWYVGGDNGSTRVQAAFGRQALPMLWDYVEVNPFGEAFANWIGMIASISTAVALVPGTSAAHVSQADARGGGAHLPNRFLLATDPPYFAQIGYADLSDYFYVWHRRALRGVLADLYRTIATPKNAELIAAPHRAGNMAKATAYFLDGFTEVFHNLAANADPNLPMIVVYAHRQEDSTESGQSTSRAWDSLLSAILAADLSVVATWPIHATSTSRQIGQGTNSLASYMILVCRPKKVGAQSISLGDYRAALRAELPRHVNDLRRAGLGGVDLGPSMIGPGIEVFCRYAKVFDAEGKALTVGAALGEISVVLGEILDDFAGDLKDDQATLWAMRWFADHGFDEGSLDHAEKLCLQSGQLSIERLRRTGIIAPPKDQKVRLVRRDELPDGWSPTADATPTVWELFQHVLRRFLSKDSDAGAASLLRQARASMADAQELGYWLFLKAERSRTEEARLIDLLLTSWPRIEELVQAAEPAGAEQLGFDTVEG